MFTEYNTGISKKNIKKIRNKRLSARDIVEYLNSGATFHTFEYILKKVYPSENLRQDMEASLRKVSDRSPATISRNVRNWISGRVLPNREDVFQLCFALGVSAEDADYLLGASSDTGIHYRNPKELIYYYGLKHHLSWQEVLVLRDRLLPICEANMKKIMDNDSLKEMITRRTRQLEADFNQKVHNEEDLEFFLIESAPYLAYLHLTAYQDFMSIIHLLQNTDSADQKMSISEIVVSYLQFGIEKKSQGKEQDYLAKAILKNWPSTSMLYKMQTRRQDVTRKIMILLFLVTEEFMTGENLWTTQISYQEVKHPRYDNILKKDYRWNADDILEVRITHMNMFLGKYGMNLLDPGLPFDCVVLYALKASYDDRKSMSDRFQEILKKLFDIEK